MKAKLELALNIGLIVVRALFVLLWESALCWPLRTLFTRVRVVTGLFGPVRPFAIEQFTTEWFTTALRASGQLTDATTRVTSFTSKLVSGPLHLAAGGTNRSVTCNLYRITLTYSAADAAAPRTVILKLSHRGLQGRIVGLLFAFHREIDFFLSVRPLFHGVMRTPACYAAYRDAFSGDYVLALEDLAPLTTFRAVPGAVITLEQLTLIAQALARLHARFWDIDHRRAGSVEAAIPLRVEPLWQRNMMADMMLRGWAKLQRFEFARNTWAKAGGGVVLAEAQHTVERYWRRLYDYAEAPSNERSYAHADFHLDNVLLAVTERNFPTASAATATPSASVSGSAGHAGASAVAAEGAPDPLAFAVVDWQIQLPQYGAIELGYCLALSLTPAERRAFEPAVLRAYFDALVDPKHGGPARTVYPYERFLLHYRLTGYARLLFICGIVVDAFAATTGSAGGLSILEALSDSVLSFCTDHHPLHAAAQLGLLPLSDATAFRAAPTAGDDAADGKTA